MLVCPNPLLPGALLAALGVALASGCSGPVGGSDGRSGSATGSAASAAALAEDDRETAAMASGGPWDEVAVLIDEQKYQAALELAEELLAEVRGGHDAEAWTRALVQTAQLETGLAGFETAVSRLRREPRPDDPLATVVLDLYLAHGLARYLDTYSWEIGQRERVAGEADKNLELWTAEEIMTAARESLARAWSRRGELGALPAARLERYIEVNDYPEGVRSTLRDALTYLWVELEADAARWTARHELETYLLDLGSLIERREGTEAETLVDPALHPLERIVALLADLESWHAGAQRREAALEARLERLRRLLASFGDEGDREAIAAELRRLTADTDHGLPWWSVAVAELAELVASGDDPWALVESLELAHQASAAHPDSIGGRRARNLAARLEAPEFSLASMSTDGLDRRSLRIGHKNLERLFFRAYSLDLASRAVAARDYDPLPDHREIEKLIAAVAPEFEWTVDLPATPDLREHATFVVPEIDAPGFYLIVASARQDFRETGNRREALTLNLSDLVLLARSQAGQVELTVRSGLSGRAVADAEVTLYRYDYRRRRHQRVASVLSDDAGRFSFEAVDRSANYFVIAEKDGQVALDPSLRLGPPEGEPQESRSALVYTDRSAYRPGQELLWKVIGYVGSRGEGRFATAGDEALEVELIDANGEVVAEAKARLNEFGSAAGSFQVPVGRLLGSWRVRTSWGGGARVVVEEYKRPTFEVTLESPAEALRLNRTARIGGEARYYFGLPLAGGSVAWRATRVPVFPRWWGWWYPRPATSEVVVASGRAQLDGDGRFEVVFRPEGDERQAAFGVSYRFRVDVEVTNEGGETRTAERTFRLGFTAVEATIETERGFLEAGTPSTVTVTRVDLDGAARAGAGEWRVVQLVQPETTPLPAELPLPPEPVGKEAEREPFRTADDGERPRWQGVSDPGAFLASWPSGREIVRGEALHGESGVATVRLPALEAGAYRLLYGTTDPFGSIFETRQELVVIAREAKTDAAAAVIEAADDAPRLPILLVAERASVEVGKQARFLVHSGLADQELVFELFHGSELLARRVLDSSSGPQVLSFPVAREHRGGLGARLTGLRDHQLLALDSSVAVPWRDRRLEVTFATFRDRLRPGDQERWSVVVEAADESALAAGSVELLAYMYDRSLDLFAPHDPSDPLALYPTWGRPPAVGATLGVSHPRWREGTLTSLPGYPRLSGDRLKFLSGYGIGGMGPRYLARQVMFEAMAATPEAAPEDAVRRVASDAAAAEETVTVTAEAAPELRTEFAETAFWEPQLRLGDDGSVSFEFTVPDSLTEWSVWVHAVTRDLASGRTERRAASAKELMVRPYLPRFLREGDEVEIRVALDNAGEQPLAGSFDLTLEDRQTGEDLRQAFGLEATETTGVPIAIASGDTLVLPFRLAVPAGLGEVAVTASARAGDWSDGEVRPLPRLPGRMHLVQSRFAALSDRARRTLRFSDLEEGSDPTLINDQLIVTIDAQLFYSVLDALPYLVTYPYECTEQLLNRFVSTGIVSTLFDDYPAVAEMARTMSARDTRLETWTADDPNRAMALEETPWLTESRGGREPAERLVKVLDPRIAAATRRKALAALAKAQTASGGFPWWPGGPPSPHMTLYLLSGFSRALEFGVEVPRPMVVEAWRYLHRHYLDEIVDRLREDECCWEMVTYLNYVLSAYPDETWTGGVFSAADRARMLEFSFRHWRQHAPLLKGYLTLTLERAGRGRDARLVFDSVMDSSRTDQDLGTYWAPEERAWLWYNDTIESHAFALRVLTELEPDDPRRHGLVQWLFLNKKLNQWKSTRATAEVLYALVHYLDNEGTLAAEEAVEVAIGKRPPRTLVFEPDEYTGRNRQIVVAGSDVKRADSVVTVTKDSRGLAFASATWHFSTERLPDRADGDLFAVERRYFKRLLVGDEWTLEPLTAESPLEPGDQLEVELTVRARHAAEYVHLRDPRPAGFEPETLTSGYRWDLGVGRYEEIRDSGVNFFFEWLPAGTYTLKHRLRANLDGVFKAAPATLQSMYAPEFAAHSAGDVVTVGD